MVYIEHVKIIDPHSSFHLKDVTLSQDESGKLILEPSTKSASLYCLPKVIDACVLNFTSTLEASMKQGGVKFAVIHQPQPTSPSPSTCIFPTLLEDRVDIDIAYSSNAAISSPLYLPYHSTLNYEEVYLLFQQISLRPLPVIKQTLQEKGVPNMPTLHGFLLGNTQLTFQPEIAQISGIIHLLSQFPQIHLMLSPYIFPELNFALPNLYYDVPIGSLIYRDTDFQSYSDLVRFPFPLLSEEQIVQMKHFATSHRTALLTSHHVIPLSSYPEPYLLEQPHFNSLPYFFVLAYNAFVLEEYLTLDDLVERLFYVPSQFLYMDPKPIEQRSLNDLFFFDPKGETLCQLHPQLPEKRMKGKIILPE